MVGWTIRYLTRADSGALRAFDCGTTTPWARALRDDINEYLPRALSVGELEALGAWAEDATLAAVAAFKIRSLSSSRLECLCPMLGVQVGWHGQGLGRLLKQRVCEEAKRRGAVVVVSRVDRRNLPMLRINRHLGAVMEPAPEEPEDILCFIPT